MFRKFKKKVFILLQITLVMLFLFYFSGCPVVEEVLNPILLPKAGTYSEPLDVEILCNTPGATIYYTIDGTDPTISPDVYTNPIHVSENTVIKVFAEKPGAVNSDIVVAEYIIEIVEPTGSPTPVPTETPGPTAIPTETMVPTVTPVPTETPEPTPTPLLKYNYTYFSIDDNEEVLWPGLGFDEIGFLQGDPYYINIFRAIDGAEGIKELCILINTNIPGEYNSMNGAVVVVYYDESGNEYYIANNNCVAIMEIETWSRDSIIGSFGAYLYCQSTQTYITLIGIFESFDSSDESRSIYYNNSTAFSDLLSIYRKRILEKK